MDFNLSTFLIQGGIFLYVLFVLNFLFFKPIMAILKRREEVTVGKVGAAEEYQRQIAELQEKYDSEINRLKSSLEESRHEAIKRQRDVAERKVQEAKTRLERQTAEKRALLVQEYEKVRDRIPTLSEGVAKEIVSAMLKSKVVRL